MPDRILRDELLTSERYWSVSIEAQRLYIHLLLNVDDTARFSGKNYTIRTSCFPGQALDPEKIERLLTELVDVDLVRVYSAENDRYVFIPRFRQKLRYVRSRYPDPPPSIDDIDPDSMPDVTPLQWQRIRAQIITRDGHSCARCSSTTQLSVDHILPRSKGGLSTPDNLITLCRSCNSWKKTNNGRELIIKEIYEKKYGSGNTLDDPKQDQSMQKRSEVKRSEEKRSEVKRRNTYTLTSFALFWSAYPKKLAKGPAEKSWTSLAPDEQTISRILQAIEAAKSSPDWRKDGGKYIPYPATWINQRRWEDEIQTVTRPASIV